MEKKRPYWQVAVSLLFSILATVAFIFIGVKAVLFFMPFVVGSCIASIAVPVVNWLEKKFNIVKKLGSALVVIVVIAIIVAIFYFAISRLILEIGDLIENVPDLYSQLENGLRQIGGTLSGLFSRLPESVQDGWNTAIVNLDQMMGDLVKKASEPTMEAAGNFAKKLPSYVIYLIMALMSSYFFTVQREDVIQWLCKIAPPSVEKRMKLVMDNLRYAVGGYFKAQFKIMGIVFLILAVGFAMLRINYFVLVAFFIAFLDFLPFFGTGTAMIPWAVYKFFMGNYTMAIMLIVIYAITQVSRQLLQPKLVADSVGLNPLVTLILLYIGYRVSSVIGMIVAVPIGMVIINMCQAGAFDYIFDDVKILVEGILGLREESNK